MKFVAKSRPGIAGAVLLAVIAAAGIASPADAADPACAGGTVKYYRNPMGTPDTSPVPKKDSMNMDYIPVCEDATGGGPGTVKISLDKVQLLGVRSMEVQERALSRNIRAFASVQYDERRQFVVAPKFSGWIEKLAVNATGDAVTVGQPLFEVYSPELNVLQQQWRVAGRSADATDKLRYLAYPEAASTSCAGATRHRAPSPFLRRSPERLSTRSPSRACTSSRATPCSALSTPRTCG